MTVNGHKCLNLATHNYLGFAGNETVERSALVDLTDALLTAVRSRRCFTLRPE